MTDDPYDDEVYELADSVLLAQFDLLQRAGVPKLHALVMGGKARVDQVVHVAHLSARSGKVGHRQWLASMSGDEITWYIGGFALGGLVLMAVLGAVAALILG